MLELWDLYSFFLHVLRFCYRMVELRRTPPRQEKKERPVSELEKMKQQILSKKQEQEESTPPMERKLERSSSSSSGSSESESGSSSSSSSSESDAKVEKVLGKFDAIKITDSPVEEAPPKKPERLFLDEKKEETRVEKKEETRVEKKEEKRVEKKEETKKITEAEQRREKLKKEEERLEEHKREERKEQLKRIKEKYNQATSGGISSEDVDENYNSDLDPENTNQSPVMATLVKKISSMRAASKNSTGYIYVFSDSPQGSPKVRVKVGSSRCPNKRLQQAKCFNPDLYLVATYPVSQRVTALNDIQNSLTKAKLEGASDWFTGPLDNLLQIVQDNASKYPTKTLHDVTTDQSES